MPKQDAANEPAGAAADIIATAAVPSMLPLRPSTFPYHPGDVILPGYRLTKRLGSGGFGEVWRAEAPGGMGVAIKILANLGRREGGREYRALQTIKNIRHAHIVPLFGVWLKANDGRVLDENELVEAEKRLLLGGHSQDESHGASDGAGGASLESLELIVAMGLGDQTLFDRLRDNQRETGQPLPAGELLAWMQQAALALDHFNTSSRRSAENATAVQHCDIKPQNMLLVGDVVQVCDFGLARAQGEVRATSNTMASLAYAAPEMVSPPYDPSPATDQYSLALTYIELRTGRLPYTDLTPMTILRAKLDGHFDLSSVAPAEARVLMQALAVDPKKRWQSCTEFVRTLGACLPRERDSRVIRSHEILRRTTGSHPHADADRAATHAPQLSPRETIPSPGARPAGTSVEDRGAGRTHRGMLAGAAAAALAVLAGGYAAFGPRSQPSPPPQQLPEAGNATRPEAATTTATTTAPDLLTRAASLERQGDFVAAAQAYATALDGQPDKLAAILWSLQTKAADAGRTADCIPLLDRLERLYAANPAPKVEGISRWDIVNSLAWYLATRKASDAAEALRARSLAEEAISLAGRDPLMRAESLDTLAASHARSGSMDEAVERIGEAIGLVRDDGQRAEFEKRRDRYRRGLPWDEP